MTTVCPGKIDVPPRGSSGSGRGVGLGLALGAGLSVAGGAGAGLLAAEVREAEGVPVLLQAVTARHRAAPVSRRGRRARVTRRT